MIIVRSKPRPQLDLTQLMLLSLKYIYAREDITYEEESQMKQGLVRWVEYLNDKKDFGKCNMCNGSGLVFRTQAETLRDCAFCDGKGYQLKAVDEEIEDTLMRIGKIHKMNNDGELDDRKRLFKEHNISYLKFHRIPGAVTEEDKHKAQESLEKAKKKNPDDYQ